ncbi:hypothetical protein BT96DRAFT_913619 [Gymnopus androsaceus JB14]|uniref:glucan 1,4-alpha-glucosidase n=1 Tax=Gymnopus androsaceus JB14 TaxID=1447944 RepID=A0A6A4IEA7_9AGAR|nr:hypothetical protein BT96DRAFT_913619 [Gymnopus androsaceus JB14]
MERVSAPPQTPCVRRMLLLTLFCIFCIVCFSFPAFTQVAATRAFNGYSYSNVFGVMASSQFPIAAGWNSVSDYVQYEGRVAQAELLANIGPKAGAAAGIVIASPSTSNPNYFYSWTRDAALVFNTVVDSYTRTGNDSNDYADAQEKLQQVPNPSGNESTGGLGEPKFNVDLSAYVHSWGRPQRDGPALRAIDPHFLHELAIGPFQSIHTQISSGPSFNAISNTLPTAGIRLGRFTFIFMMLQCLISLFIALIFWEEISSSSFWTTAVQHKALLGNTDAADTFSSQADNALCFLQSLASIHTFDPAAGCDSLTFQPCSDKALSNLKVYVDSFKDIYAINEGLAENQAKAVGRYKEDVYMGGNPWYLATFAVAEQLYRSLSVWDTQNSLEITPISLSFFHQFFYGNLTSEIRAYADDFISMNARYTPENGSLAEQYSKDDGEPCSARDLTWSYASALTAFEARQGILPSSWGAQGLEILEKNTVYGENVFIVGSIDQLGDWEPEKATKLDPQDYPIWTVQMRVPASTSFNYKYIVQDGAGDITWENDPNRQIISPAEGLIVERSDSWQG